MDDDIKESLAAQGFSLLTPPTPRYQYLPWREHQDLLYLSGKTPVRPGEPALTGLLGTELTLEQGRRGAVLCAVNLLEVIEAAVGLNRIAHLVKLTGYVASGPGFVQQPEVVDAASQFLVDVLGDRGRHARTAVGVAALPGNAPVELDLVVAITASPVEGA